MNVIFMHQDVDSAYERLDPSLFEGTAWPCMTYIGSPNCLLANDHLHPQSRMHACLLTASDQGSTSEPANLMTI